MSLLFLPLGGGNEIGASAYYLKAGGEKFLLDCGVRLDSPLYYPDFSPLYRLPGESLDGLWELTGAFISHGHFDHLGGIPKLYQESRGEVPVYTTRETAGIARLQLMSMKDNKVNKAFHEGRGAPGGRRSPSPGALDNPDSLGYSDDLDWGLRIYPQELVRASLAGLQEVGQGHTLKFPYSQVTFFPAGHILGASMIYLETEGGNILYTGDFSDFPQLTVPAYRLPANLPVDVLVTESTYGFQDRPRGGSQGGTGGKRGLQEYLDGSFFYQQERKELALAVAQVTWLYGTALLPAFALGRSQEVALALRECMEEKLVPEFPIYLDGMAAAFSDIYEGEGIGIYGPGVKRAPRHYPRCGGDLSGKAVISSSGMLLEGSCSSRYAARLLPEEKNALFFTGFLPARTPGGRLAQISGLNGGSGGNGDRGTRGKPFIINSQEISLRARVGTYSLSAHAGPAGIVNLIKKLQPKKVIFVHGFPGRNRGVDVREIASRQVPWAKYYQGFNGEPLYLN